MDVKRVNRGTLSLYVGTKFNQARITRRDGEIVVEPIYVPEVLPGQLRINFETGEIEEAT